MDWVINKPPEIEREGSPYWWMGAGKLLFDNKMCQAQGIVLTFTSFSQESWLMTIFINCFYLVKHHDDSIEITQKGENSLLPYIIVINIAFPLFFVLLFATFAEYGRSSLYCWLKRLDMKENLEYLVNYITKGVMLLINGFIFWKIISKIRKYYMKSKSEEMIGIGKSILVRILIYIGIELFGSLVQTITRFSHFNSSLMIPGVILNAAQGIFFGICVFINERCLALLKNTHIDERIDSQTVVIECDDD